MSVWRRPPYTWRRKSELWEPRGGVPQLGWACCQGEFSSMNGRIRGGRRRRLWWGLGKRKSDPLEYRTRAGERSCPRCWSTNMKQISCHAAHSPACFGQVDDFIIRWTPWQGRSEWALKCDEKSWLMETEAQTINYMDHRRLTLDLARPGVNTHSDDSQGERVSPFHSMPPVA